MPLRLTTKEREVLAALEGAAPAHLSRQELFDRVWGAGHAGSLRLVDNVVARLRAKLGERGPTRLVTVHGHGYRWDASDEPNSLIGRDRELAELEHLLANARLVTITGAPGVGKTHLARTFARRAGTTFVDLSAVEGEGAFWVALSTALGVEPGARTFDAASTEREIGKRGSIVLVLDNVEQIRSLVSGTIEGWFKINPALRIVATSQVVLECASEQLALKPLSLEGATSRADSPAVELFLRRSSDRGDLASVVEAVELVEGLPLAIVLASARTAVLTPKEIAERLRTDTLLLGRHDGSERHDSIELALAWSWSLLSAEEAGLLERLSLLEGAFDVAMVEALAQPDAAIDLLERLVAHALVDRVPGPDHRRYRLLRCIRDHGLRKLQRDPARLEDAQARRARHYKSVVASDPLDGGFHGPTRSVRDLSLEDLEAAVRWASHQPEPAQWTPLMWKLVSTHTSARPRQQSRDLCTDLLSAWERDQPARAWLAVHVAMMDVLLGRSREARSALLAVLWSIRREHGLRSTEALAWSYLAQIEQYTDSESQAVLALRVAIRLADPVAPRYLALACLNLGNLLRTRSALDEAERNLERAFAIYTAAGEIHGTNSARSSLGILLLERGRVHEARRVLGAAAQAHRELGSSHHEAVTLVHLAAAECAIGGSMEDAERWVRRALVLYEGLGERSIPAAFGTLELARLQRIAGRLDLADATLANAREMCTNAAARCQYHLEVAIVGCLRGQPGAVSEALGSALEHADRSVRGDVERVIQWWKSGGSADLDLAVVSTPDVRRSLGELARLGSTRGPAAG